MNTSTPSFQFSLFAAGFARALPRCFVACLLGTLTACIASAAAPEDDDAFPVRVPGLIAVYSHPATQLEFTRYEPIPAWDLQRDQSPDPRLPATGWRVHLSLIHI